LILLYIDEDAMEDTLVRGLAARNIDAVTVMQARTRAHMDVVQLEYAASQGRTLFSYNVGDYRRLHSEFIEAGKHHAGIVVTQQQRLGLARSCAAL
jgi:hypothetical protein